METWKARGRSRRLYSKFCAIVLYYCPTGNIVNVNVSPLTANVSVFE
jgi:hypothetical protein